MPKKLLELPRIADPTIEQILQQYRDDCAASKKVGKAARDEAIDFFIASLNGYAHQSLSEDETKIFEHYFELEDDEHKEFCQVFGADN